jgi:hypothetical protein
MIRRVILDDEDAMHARDLSIARLKIRRGDTVVVRIARPLTQGDAEHVREYVKASLPPNTPVLVLDSNAELSVAESTADRYGRTA